MEVALTPPGLKRERWSKIVCMRGAADDAAIISFSCAHDLDDAESIVGCYLLAHESDLEVGPLVAAIDELIGRAVVDIRHGDLGVIREVLETLANDVWVVDGGPYGEVLIPVVSAVLDEIPAFGEIPVHTMDGLLDL